MASCNYKSGFKYSLIGYLYQARKEHKTTAAFGDACYTI